MEKEDIKEILENFIIEYNQENIDIIKKKINMIIFQKSDENGLENDILEIQNRNDYCLVRGKLIYCLLDCNLTMKETQIDSSKII